MEPRAHHVLIGLFAVLSLAAALLFALWLNKSTVDQALSDYVVVFDETVSGLSKGSAVQYSGITIGEVASLELDPEDPRKVHARIRVLSQAPIKQDTRARLTITGITGIAVIQLLGGTPQSPRLLGDGEQPPQIIAERSVLAQLMSNGDDLLLSLSGLLKRADRLLSDANIERVSRTLEHLERTTASVAERRDQLRLTLQEFGAASQETAKLMRSANQLLDGPGRQTLANTERLMASLERSSRNLERLLGDNREALDSGLQGLGELGPAIHELRDTLGALRSFSRRLEQDPAGYLLRGERLQEFQP
ncbi:MCE family protein [Pseudomonas sp. LPB0260]|uniref:MlaD family protein n=1 Tax=Pseudomonas sp. LPB0260 TaxID=2614442 RepID=UPI0015C1EAE0|nr:MlaD family protein [Pseudomonas sp. LPB0260]QLC73379.1 MCE family protein [Pseudomonas sp. LPB0260]QLC76153.1 MCE family protein [Pseudomonas sp. LPB0260]